MLGRCSVASGDVFSFACAGIPASEARVKEKSSFLFISAGLRFLGDNSVLNRF